MPISPEELRKQRCLQAGDETEGRSLFKERMDDFLLLALLPCNQDLLSSVIIHHDPARLLLAETADGHLPSA
jgi:hypothetical protein